MDPASLQAAIKKQVEFYFSRENLMKDLFLVGQMDANHYVPISVILEVRCSRIALRLRGVTSPSYPSSCSLQRSRRCQ